MTKDDFISLISKYTPEMEYHINDKDSCIFVNYKITESEYSIKYDFTNDILFYPYDIILNKVKRDNIFYYEITSVDKYKNITETWTADKQISYVSKTTLTDILIKLHKKYVELMVKMKKKELLKDFV